MVRLGRLVPLLVLAAACASKPPPGATGPESCALAIAVRVKNPDHRDGGWARPRRVYFVRFGPEDDPLRAQPVIASNHTHGRLVYLLNAAPGRYAAVACVEQRDGRELTTTFSKELVLASVVTVAPGRFAFLGSHEIRQTLYRDNADEAQQHYAPLVEPDWDRANLITRVFGRSRYFLGRDHRRVDDAARRIDEAREHLSPGGWQDRFGAANDASAADS